MGIPTLQNLLVGGRLMDVQFMLDATRKHAFVFLHYVFPTTLFLRSVVLHNSREGGFVNIAEGRHVVMADPFPKGQLLAGHRRTLIKQGVNTFQLNSCGRGVVKAYHNSHMTLVLTERNEHPHANTNALLQLGWNKVGEGVERDG